MKVGYAYSSEVEQTLEQQVKRLQDSGCERIYQETLAGVRADRPKLKKCLDSLRAGDTFIVCRLDRIGTKIEKVLILLNELVNMEVTFISLGRQFKYERACRAGTQSYCPRPIISKKRRVFIARVHEGRKEAEKRGIKFGQEGRH